MKDLPNGPPADDGGTTGSVTKEAASPEKSGATQPPPTAFSRTVAPYAPDCSPRCILLNKKSSFDIPGESDDCGRWGNEWAEV